MTDKPILGVDIGTISSIFRNERGLIYLASTCLPSIVKKVNRKINSGREIVLFLSSYIFFIESAKIHPFRSLVAKVEVLSLRPLL